MKSMAGQNLASAIGETFAQWRGPTVQECRADLVTAVPMHWRGRIARGCNNPELLADRLARSLKIGCEPFLLKKIRHTKPQKNLSWNQRKMNIKGAFEVRSGFDLTGATVVLVDDVVTSGATCHEASKMLKKAGVKKVIIACIARAG
jgi:ComF family protein